MDQELDRFLIFAGKYVPPYKELGGSTRGATKRDARGHAQCQGGKMRWDVRHLQSGREKREFLCHNRLAVVFE